MKKRLIALLLAMSMTLSLAACGNGKTDAEFPEQDVAVSGDTGDDADGSVEEPQEVPEGETESGEIQNADGSTTENTAPEVPDGVAATDEKPADTAQKPAEKPGAPAEKPAQKPAAPAEKPTEKPAEEAQSKPAAKVDLTAFYESVISGADMPAMMQVEGETLDMFYPGLTAIKTNQCGVYTAMISAVVGEIALVEVQNTADVQAVKDIFQARIDYQVGDDENPGGAWYPETIEGWKNGSRIVSNGNYVMLVALYDGADSVVDSFNALFA